MKDLTIKTKFGAENAV